MTKIGFMPILRFYTIYTNIIKKKKMSNLYVPPHTPIEDAHKIFVEKCIEEGITPPTFEE